MQKIEAIIEKINILGSWIDWTVCYANNATHDGWTDRHGTHGAWKSSTAHQLSFLEANLEIATLTPRASE